MLLSLTLSTFFLEASSEQRIVNLTQWVDEGAYFQQARVRGARTRLERGEEGAAPTRPRPPSTAREREGSVEERLELALDVYAVRERAAARGQQGRKHWA